MSLGNIAPATTVRDRDGNLTDGGGGGVLASITNRFLAENVDGGDNSPLIDAFDCRKIAQNLSKMEEIVSNGNNNNNNNNNGNNNAFGSELTTRPNHAATTKRSRAATLLNDFELINLDDLKLDPDDCWLYKPTKKHRTLVNPCSWVQDGFSEVKVRVSGPSLLQMLCANCPRKGSHSRIARTLTRPSRSVAENRNASSVHSSVDSSHSSPRPQKDNQKPLNRTYDKKDLEEMFAKMRQGNAVEQTTNSSSTPKSNEAQTGARERQKEGKRTIARAVKCNESAGNCLQDAGHQKLVDMSDVQMLAKMQEDNLRKSFTSSSGRLIKSDLNKSTGHLVDNCDQGSPLHRTNHSSPGRPYDMKEFRKSRSSLTSASSGSCSPHESLADINSATGKASIWNSTASQQRSLPNLLKNNGEVLPPRNAFAPSGERVISPAPSPLQLPLQQQQPPPPRRSGLKQPSKRIAAAPSAKPDAWDETPCSNDSAADFNQNSCTAPASKVTSLIPRPNAFSRIRPPSKIATVKRVLTAPMQMAESSWREGCF